jgi:transposase-like protein
MGRKSRFSFDTKFDIVQRCLAGKTTVSHEAKCFGISRKRVREWISLYQSLGTVGLITTSKNTAYSSSLKQKAVLDYIDGKGSHSDICKKYGIRSTKQLRDWILKYNGHIELKASGAGGSTIMTKGRKTTFDERIEIVQYCIAHNHNYAETSEKYQLSYQQARNYTVKYETDGVEALRDNRGKRKSQEEMSELEKLRAENKILRAEKERAEMEVSFLKKLEEIERRRG